MITVEEALQRILGHVSVLETERKPLLKALGQTLSEDIYASIAVPPADNSAMDGFALCEESTRGASPASPKVLRVIGQVAAGGTPEQTVTPGTAVRIMTGAPVPPGADTVVPFEDTDEEQRRSARADLSALAHIGILKEVPQGSNIRRAGEDIAPGSLLFPTGTVLHAPQIGVLASIGLSAAPVVRRPRIAIIGTGDELTELGTALAPGRIYNSNSYALAARVLSLGAIPLVLGIARDQAGELREKIRAGLDSDLLLTSGGVSLGDYDMVKGVLAQEGEMTFWTVRMKPGKPLAFGLFQHRGRRVPHLGLPGNPVSSLITFEVFARPAILKMMGRTDLSPILIKAVLQDKVTNNDGRRVYSRVRLCHKEGQYWAQTTGPQGSGILTSMAYADGLAIIPEEVPAAKPGDVVEVIVLDWSQERIRVPCN